MTDIARVNIGGLQRDAPEWAWTAERYGMGWRYVGTLGASRVIVYATAQICGPSEDDFATVWCVDDGRTSVSYAIWLMRRPTINEPQAAIE